MENTVLSILIQGGAVGLCLAILFVLYKVLTNHFVHSDEMWARNADAWKQHSETNVRLICAVESLEKTVQSKL